MAAKFTVTEKTGKKLPVWADTAITPTAVQ